MAFYKVNSETAGNSPTNAQFTEIVQDYLAAGFGSNPKSIIMDNIKWQKAIAD